MPIHTGSVDIPKPAIARGIQEYDPAAEMFVANQVLPFLDSQIQDGTLPIVARDDMLRIENTVLSPGAAYGRVEFRDKGLLFHCVKNGLEAKLPDEIRAFYADMFDCEMVYGRQLVSALARAREKRVTDAIFNATTWTGATLNTDYSISGPWATVGSDVVTQIAGAAAYVQLNSGLLPNALIINTVNLNRLLANTVIRARFPGATLITRDILRQNLSAIFGLQYLIEAGAIKNSAPEAATYVGAFVWSSSYAMVARVVPPGSPPDTAGLGRTVRWTALMGSTSEYEAMMYRDSHVDSDILKIRNYLDELVLGTAYGHLLTVA